MFSKSSNPQRLGRNLLREEEREDCPFDAFHSLPRSYYSNKQLIDAANA